MFFAVLRSIRNRSESATKATPHSVRMNLLSDVQLLDDSSVSLDVCLLEVTEKISSVTYHLKKTATAVEVLVVVLEVRVEVVDAVCEERDLNLGRTCVAFVSSIFLNNSLLYVFLHDVFTFLKFIICVSSDVGG